VRVSARLDLRPPPSRGRIRTTPDHLSHRHRCQVARSRGPPRAGGSGLLSRRARWAIRVGSLRARVGHGYQLLLRLTLEMKRTRASELCDLQWSQVELATGRLHVRRAKNGSPSVHSVRSAIVAGWVGPYERHLGIKVARSHLAQANRYIAEMRADITRGRRLPRACARCWLPPRRLLSRCSMRSKGHCAYSRGIANWFSIS
jgi:hypothetical protein